MLVLRQEYSRELKIACMRELDSGKGWPKVACQYQLSPKTVGDLEGRVACARGELAFPGKGARPQARLDGERIAVLERKIGRQTMEIDFLNKVLRRFTEHPIGVVANGGTACTSKGRKPPRRRQA